MIAYIQANAVTICSVLVGLLTLSETLPFIQKIESNGIVQAIINQMKKIASTPKS